MSTRKSNVGVARRVAPKPHIPYRADDLGVGKKTGVAVDRVDRKSDGFEPFQAVVELMDNKRSPPRAKSNIRKKSTPVDHVEEEEVNDEGAQDMTIGEMSMELDDTPTRPAYSHLANDSHTANSGNPTFTSSSRRFNRPSNAVFDKVPSPRAQSSSKRKSLTNGSAPASSAPSHFTADDPGDIDPGDFLDDTQPENSMGEASSPHQPSSTGINGKELEAAESENLNPSPRPQKKNKGKEKAQTPEPDDEETGGEMEEEITRGLGDVELEDDDLSEEPVNKKPRKGNGKAPSRPRKKKQQERSPTPDGVRRGRRHRYPPLQYWRLEKVVYSNKADSGGKIYVPHIKEIVRIPQEPVHPLGKFKRKRSAPPRAESKAAESHESSDEEEPIDKDTDQSGIVLDFPSRDEVERRVAFTSSMVIPKAAANSEWYFQKIFGDGDFIAAGQLLIPPQVKKPGKGTKDNTYVFYVIEGAISVRIHNTLKVLAAGGMFMVPRGNTYSIENVSDRNAKIFFAQARKIALSEEEQASVMSFAGATGRSPESQRPMSRPPPNLARSSSVSSRIEGRSRSQGPSKDPSSNA